MPAPAVFLFLWSWVPLVYLFIVLFSSLITDIQERLTMEDTGRILLFLALILATARSVHAIYYKEAAGELQSYIVHIDPTKVQIPDSMNPATWYASFIHDLVVKIGALNNKQLT